MLRKISTKFQPNFQHYVKKIEAQAKKWFSYKKKRVAHFTINGNSQGLIQNLNI